MKRYLECFEDFYGCTHSIMQQADGTFRMASRTPHGDLFHIKTYATRKGCMIALGRMAEGTAKPTTKHEAL